MTSGLPPTSTRTTRSCPRYASRFIGRRREMDLLEGSLLPGRLTTVVGMGGVGKTRLVSEAVRSSGKPALFVDASTATDPVGLARALLRDLRSEGPVGEDLVAHAASALASAELSVVVLDNLEQLGERAGEVIEAIRQRASALTVLCTSRVPVGAPGEQLIALEPFGEDQLDEAVQLFVHALPRLGQSPIDPVLDRPRIEAIVGKLEGVPLAIELAAGRTAVLPLEEVEQRLESEPLALLRDPSQPSSRERTLSRSIAWSAELLPPEARDTLEQLGCFAGPFALAAARHVISVGADVADPLQLLVTWHLLRIEPDGCFAPFETVRAWAAEALQHRPDRDAVLDRHGQYFLSLAEKGRGEVQADRLFRNADEFDRVIARGLQPGASAERLAVARRLEDAIYRLETVRRSASEHRALLGRLIDAGPPDPAVLALLASKGLMELHLRDPAEAGPTFQRLLALALELGDRSKEALAYLHLASVAEISGQPEAIEALVDKALAAARAAGDREMEMWALGGIVNQRPYNEGRFEEVLERLEPALAIARELGPAPTVRMLLLRVTVDLARGDFAAARAVLQEIRQIQAAEGQVPWFRVEMVVENEMLLELAERGGEALERVLALAAELPPTSSALGRSNSDALVAVALSLAGRPFQPVALEALPPSRERFCMSALMAALLPRDPSRLTDLSLATDPAGRAIAASVALIADLAHGRIAPDQALASFDRIEPASAWKQVLRQILLREVALARAEASTWQIASDGRWFLPPGGERVLLESRPRLARLLAALARDRATADQGLDVTAMFEAGWPGERAVEAAQANRVRVAVSTLRGMGLTVLAWERGRGWYLDAHVRLV